MAANVARPRTQLPAVLAAGVLGFAVPLGASTAADATTVEQRVHVQVRNVTQGQELRLEIVDPKVVNLLIADIRLGGTAERLEDDEVLIDGKALVVRTDKPRINLNITLHALCESTCPTVIDGDVALPRSSYAMLRTAVQDVTLTRSGAWTLKLSGG